MVEVCVIIGSGDLPPAGFATYNLTTNDRTAIGMFGVCVYHLNTCMYLLTTHNSWWRLWRTWLIRDFYHNARYNVLPYLDNRRCSDWRSRAIRCLACFWRSSCYRRPRTIRSFHWGHQQWVTKIAIVRQIAHSCGLLYPPNSCSCHDPIHAHHVHCTREWPGGRGLCVCSWFSAAGENDILSGSDSRRHSSL